MLADLNQIISGITDSNYHSKGIQNHAEFGESGVTDATKGVFDDDMGNTSLLWYLKILDASCKHCGLRVCSIPIFHSKANTMHHDSEKVRSAAVDYLDRC